jgi:hypothetical protein
MPFCCSTSTGSCWRPQRRRHGMLSQDSGARRGVVTRSQPDGSCGRRSAGRDEPGPRAWRTETSPRRRLAGQAPRGRRGAPTCAPSPERNRARRPEADPRRRPPGEQHLPDAFRPDVLAGTAIPGLCTVVAIDAVEFERCCRSWGSSRPAGRCQRPGRPPSRRTRFRSTDRCGYGDEGLNRPQQGGLSPPRYRGPNVCPAQRESEREKREPFESSSRGRRSVTAPAP